MEKINVIVIGAIHHNTLGVVRSLGEEGIPCRNIIVLLVENKFNSKNIISKSKYLLPENIHYVESNEEIVPWLENNSSKGKKVIVCCSDGAAEAVIKESRKLKSKYETPEAIMSIEDLMIKGCQDELAVECGMIVPFGKTFKASQNIVWETFPCIIKPLKSTSGAGKADIRIVHSHDELIENLKTIKTDYIQIQQYINKKMEYQLIGCSLENGKIIIIPGFTNILRQPEYTNTGYLIYSPIGKLDFDRNAVELFIRKTGYSGLFSVEFIRDQNNKDYFLEMNFRNDGNAYCVKSAGVNLPYIWVYYKTFGVMPDCQIEFSTPIHFIPDFSDLKISVKKIGLFKWLKDFKSSSSHSIYNKKDIKPFFFEFWRNVKRTLIKKISLHD